MSELSPQPGDCAQAVPGKREYSQSPPPHLSGVRRPHQPTAGLQMRSVCFHCPLSHQETPRGESAPPQREVTVSKCWDMLAPWPSPCSHAGPPWHWDMLGTLVWWLARLMWSTGKPRLPALPSPDHPPAATLVWYWDMLGTQVQWWARLMWSTCEPQSPALPWWWARLMWSTGEPRSPALPSPWQPPLPMGQAGHTGMIVGKAHVEQRGAMVTSSPLTLTIPLQPHWSPLVLGHAGHTGMMVGKAHVEHRRATVTSSPLMMGKVHMEHRRAVVTSSPLILTIPLQSRWFLLALGHARHTGMVVGKAHMEHRRAVVTSSPLILTIPLQSCWSPLALGHARHTGMVVGKAHVEHRQAMVTSLTIPLQPRWSLLTHSVHVGCSTSFPLPSERCPNLASDKCPNSQPAVLTDLLVTRSRLWRTCAQREGVFAERSLGSQLKFSASSARPPPCHTQSTTAHLCSMRGRLWEGGRECSPRICSHLYQDCLPDPFVFPYEGD